MTLGIQILQLVDDQEIEWFDVSADDLDAALAQLPAPLAVGASSPLWIDIQGPLTDAERAALLARIRYVPGETPPEEPPDWLYDVQPPELDVTPGLVPETPAYVVLQHREPDGPYHEMLCLPLRGADDTFRFVPVSPPECWNAAYVRYDHWHPGSRTSGWWTDAAGLAAPGVFAVWHLRDEEGTFLELEPIDDRDPEVVASRIAAFVDDFDVGECEKVLLGAHVHGVIDEVLQGVEFVIDLFTDENPGYCMTPRFDLPAEIRAALRPLDVTAVGRALATPGSPEHAQYVQRLGEDAGAIGEERVARLREALAGAGEKPATRSRWDKLHAELVEERGQAWVDAHRGLLESQWAFATFIGLIEEDDDEGEGNG